jgi:sorbitol-specific phosphotransferase system component IIC
VDNLGGLIGEKGVVDMKQSYTHTFPPVIHTLYKTNPRTEQGFYNLPTENRSGYYDYLYIIHPVTRITFPHYRKAEDRDEIYSRAVSVSRWG